MTIKEVNKLGLAKMVAPKIEVELNNGKIYTGFLRYIWDDDEKLQLTGVQEPLINKKHEATFYFYLKDIKEIRLNARASKDDVRSEKFVLVLMIILGVITLSVLSSEAGTSLVREHWEVVIVSLIIGVAGVFGLVSSTKG